MIMCFVHAATDERVAQEIKGIAQPTVIFVPENFPMVNIFRDWDDLQRYYNLPEEEMQKIRQYGGTFFVK